MSAPNRRLPLTLAFYVLFLIAARAPAFGENPVPDPIAGISQVSGVNSRGLGMKEEGKYRLTLARGENSPATSNRPADFARNGGGVATQDIADNTIGCAVLDTVHGFAYLGTIGHPGKIVKVRLSDLTNAAVLTPGAAYNDFISVAMDEAGGFAYFSTSGSTAQIVKIRLSDFSLVSSLTLDAGEKIMTQAMIDPGAGFAYFAGSGRVVKVRLSDFTRVGACFFGGNISCFTLYPERDEAYVGFSDYPETVKRMKLSTLAVNGACSLAVPNYTEPWTDYDHNTVEATAVDKASGDVCFWGLGTHTIIVSHFEPPLPIIVTEPETIQDHIMTRVRLSDFTRGESTIDGQHTNAVVDPMSGNIYFETSSFYTGYVHAQDLTDSSPDFTSFSFDKGGSEYDYDVGCVDPSKGNLYFIGKFPHYPDMIKIRYSQKGRVNAMRVTMPENGTPKAMHLYTTGATGNVRVALYDDGAPTKHLLWQSGSIPNHNAAGFLTVPFADGAPAVPLLGPGQYWLAWQTDTTADIAGWNPGGAGLSFDQDYGDFPGGLADASTTSNANNWTEYFNYEVVAHANPPTGIALSGPRLVDDHAPYASPVGMLSTVDPNHPGWFYYAFASPENNAGGRFKIDGDKLQVADGSLLQYGDRRSWAVRIRSTNVLGLYADKVFTIGIRNPASPNGVESDWQLYP